MRAVCGGEILTKNSFEKVRILPFSLVSQGNTTKSWPFVHFLPDL